LAKRSKAETDWKIFPVSTVAGFPVLRSTPVEKVLGWSNDEVMVLIAHAGAELKNLSVHQYGKLYFIYGKKP
jgi:hypothetical protein